MLSIKTAIFLAIVACGFATELTWEQRTRCVFECNPIHQGGCGRVVDRDKNGGETQWRYTWAFETEGHPNLYNCYDTDSEFNICPEPGRLVIPPGETDMFVTDPHTHQVNKRMKEASLDSPTSQQEFPIHMTSNIDDSDILLERNTCNTMHCMNSPRTGLSDKSLDKPIRADVGHGCPTSPPGFPWLSLVVGAGYQIKPKGVVAYLAG
ncbi:uncharacterized protein PGTG_15029 [Puccinia graminis f. sp. tritici CRL 75-36-700-3]|uniref:Secreted protein n=1 Tax=Puccinia graminis f. sp. tritici (strain CRL 75-36-700-3 / race SCCL) TaxID=418459 RepID=E3KXY7_PUCGT|nr:uncharacterized protein PGTG_15029 [Puccinia graminis f. sp. tritici CRL 75-36-700-3]EFP89188.2 hypothetical protein PGTG_15029 [Puccinia graminis f. sp. tritici CRL 75-36-700-3]